MNAKQHDARYIAEEGIIDI